MYYGLALTPYTNPYQSPSQTGLLVWQTQCSSTHMHTHTQTGLSFKHTQPQWTDSQTRAVPMHTGYYYVLSLPEIINIRVRNIYQQNTHRTCITVSTSEGNEESILMSCSWGTVPWLCEEAVCWLCHVLLLVSYLCPWSGPTSDTDNIFDSLYTHGTGLVY